MEKKKEKKILKYEENQMLQALEAVKNGMPIARASKCYKVPRTTLMYKHSGKYPIKRQMGPSCVLGEYEAVLVQWILESQRNGFPISRIQLIESVKKLVVDLKLKTPFIEGKPGKKWVELFLQRHPNISQRIPETLTVSKGSVTEEKIIAWFQEVDQYLEENNLKHVLSDPGRVFNADETAFFLSPKGGKVLAKRGERCVQKIGNDEKECITVMMTVNAAGEVLPPMIIFKYERVPAYITNLVPDDWAVGKSESGWMCAPTFFEFMANLFIPWVKQKQIKLPVIFFVDGHVSHLTLQVSQLCEKMGVVLVCLPPNPTHVTQPLDVAVFHPLKTAWRDALNRFKQEMNIAVVQKEHFSLILKKVLDGVDLKMSIGSGFAACGLFPFTIQGIDMRKLLASSPEEKGNKTKSAQLSFFTSHVNFIDLVLGTEKVACFRKNIEESAEWTGPESDRSLFNFYRKVRGLVEGSTESPYNGDYQSTPTDQQRKSRENGEENYINSCEKTPEKDLSFLPSNVNERSPTQNLLTPNPEPSTSYSKVNKTLPSPFKRLMMWPEILSSKSKRPRREHIPFVVTSSAYKEYYEKKNRKKEDEEEAKRKRKEEREMRKQMKEKQKEKLKKKSHRAATKTSETEPSDDEISLYSEECDDLVDYEKEMEDQLLETTGDGKKTEQKKTESLVLPDNNEKKIGNKQRKNIGNDKQREIKLNNIQKGTYVIIKYEGEYFPGLVKDEKGQEFYISTMKMSGYNWKWYEKGHEDIMWYSREEIVQIISTPVKVNDRGTFRIPKMDILKNIIIV